MKQATKRKGEETVRRSKIVRYLKKPQREENLKTVSKVADAEINEQECEMEEVDHRVEDEDRL